MTKNEFYEYLVDKIYPMRMEMMRKRIDILENKVRIRDEVIKELQGRGYDDREWIDLSIDRG